MAHLNRKLCPTPPPPPPSRMAMTSQLKTTMTRLHAPRTTECRSCSCSQKTRRVRRAARRVRSRNILRPKARRKMGRPTRSTAAARLRRQCQIQADERALLLPQAAARRQRPHRARTRRTLASGSTRRSPVRAAAAPPPPSPRPRSRQLKRPSSDRSPTCPAVLR